MSQDPELLRRLLRAKDRMDAASHEAWPVRRLARVSGTSEAHFARSFKEAFGVPPGVEFTQEPVARFGSVDATLPRPVGQRVEARRAPRLTARGDPPREATDRATWAR